MLLQLNREPDVYRSTGPITDRRSIQSEFLCALMLSSNPCERILDQFGFVYCIDLIFHVLSVILRIIALLTSVCLCMSNLCLSVYF